MSEKIAHKKLLSRDIGPVGAWAFALGTSIGWGSLVVTNNTYLSQAGPAGSCLGMIVGTMIMLVISRNYAYMVNAYPEAGGAYSYSREAYGYDHGFLTAWFLSMTYFAVLWANATSLPLFARYFLGEIFRVGRLYSLFDYEVYLGEAFLSIAGILIFAFFCVRFKKIAARAMAFMVILFSLGIIICFAAAYLKHGPVVKPGFVPDSSALSQIVKIACVSPWAFIGFENISHNVEEFTFKRSKVFRILVIAVISTTLLYICVMLLSVTAYPPQFGSWLEYLRNLDKLSGIEALPAFYAARHYMGYTGVTILMLSLLALIFTSLIGNMTALSRLFYAMAKDGILPERFGRVNSYGAPGQAILLIVGISVFIPFLGRTAIGWIVDVTTLGATLIYGFVSAATWKLAKQWGDKQEEYTGMAGLAACLGIGLYLLLPNLFSTGNMATESFFLFVVWGVLGFFFFRFILKHDREKHFGNSIVVWIGLLSLVLFVSLVWMSRSIMDATDKGMVFVEQYYTKGQMTTAQTGVVTSQINMVRQAAARSIIVVTILFILSLWVLLNNYNLMSRRALSSEQQLGQVRNLAYTDPLTGVKSKLAYAEMEKEINERIRDKTQDPFSLVVCDVNGLKKVNDTLGHKAGDAYIQNASQLICSLFAHSPVYRTGGDEFVVIVSGNDYENRHDIMEELHRQSAGRIGSSKAVVSGGLADYDSTCNTDLHAVFEEADEKMYKEKKVLKSMGATVRS